MPAYDEMSLLEHASSVPAGLHGRLKLVTVEAGCERLAGIQAFVINHLSIEETA
jgi:hypothetical protein